MNIDDKKSFLRALEVAVKSVLIRKNKKVYTDLNNPILIDLDILRTEIFKSGYVSMEVNEEKRNFVKSIELIIDKHNK